MNKKVLTYALVAVGILVLAGTGVAFANENFNRAEVKGEITNGECDCSQAIKNMRHEFRGRDLSIKAEVLGMSLEELEAELENKTFHDLVEEKSLTQDEVRAKTQEIMKSRMKERLDQLVADGEINEEEAEERLNNMRQRKGRKNCSSGCRGGCGISGSSSCGKIK